MKRSGWGALLALAILVWSIALYALNAELQNSRPDGMQVQAEAGGARVTGVIPGSVAARAGIASGDALRFDGYAEAYRLAYVFFPGRPFAVDVASPGRSPRRVILTFNRPRAGKGMLPLDMLQSALFSLPAFLGALLVWRRLNAMTAAFAIYTTFGPFDRSAPLTLLAPLPDSLFGPLAIAIDALMSTIPLAALLPFLARFPKPSERSRPLIRAADIAFGVIVVLTLFVTVRNAEIVRGAREAQDALASITAVLLALCAALSLARKHGDDRARTGWVLAGLAVTAAAYAFNVAHAGESIAQSLTVAVLMGALPAAVTYAVLRHRVLDLGFVLNRGLIYATLTALLLITVSLVDWGVGHLIAETRLAVALEILVSVAFGVGLNWMHQRVEKIIDSLLFRKRRRAQDRIEVRIAALEFATVAAAVDSALVEDAARILDLSSAAVFRIAGGAYVRTSAVGWDGCSERLEENDLLVRALFAGEGTRVIEELDLGEPDFPIRAARPDLAIPIVLRHRLIAIALYGRPADGTTLDAVERGLLERLARAAASAYEAAEMARWSSLTAGAPRLQA